MVFDFDRINGLNVHDMADDSYLVVDAVQSLPPERQVAAAAMFLRLVGAVKCIDIRRVMEVVDRATHHAQQEGYHKVRAAEDYISSVVK